MNNIFVLVNMVETLHPAAYKLNCDKGFEEQHRIFAVLTDLQDFYFFSYDGSTFSRGYEIMVSSCTREAFLRGMVEGQLFF